MDFDECPYLEGEAFLEKAGSLPLDIYAATTYNNYAKHS
jgi:hypothetical protein